MTLIIGHRGASYCAPENTAAAFRVAFEEGADGIECDFRLSRDRQIVCIHDNSTGRTSSGYLKVDEASLTELLELDFGAWKGSQWRGARIQTLKEVLLDLPEGKRVFLELKTGPEILDPLAAALASSGVDAGQIRILAFDADVVRLAKRNLPGYRACWLTDYHWRGGWTPSPVKLLGTLRRSFADGLASRNKPPLDLALVSALRAEGYEVHVWTVDDVAEARRCHRLGVDSIMTNRPGLVRKAIDCDVPTSGAGAGETR